MTFGIGQILLILFVMLLFFGNFSSILNDLAKVLNTFKKIFSKKSKYL